MPLGTSMGLRTDSGSQVSRPSRCDPKGEPQHIRHPTCSYTTVTGEYTIVSLAKGTGFSGDTRQTGRDRSLKTLLSLVKSELGLCVNSQ